MTVSGNSKVTMADSLWLGVDNPPDVPTGTLTLNGGQIIVGTDVANIADNVNDGGQIYFNDNSHLYYNGGELLVSGISEADMQGFIDNGQIVPSIPYSVTTMTVNGTDYTALVPVPEPATIGLILAGLFGFIRRRK